MCGRAMVVLLLVGVLWSPPTALAQKHEEFVIPLRFHLMRTPHSEFLDTTVDTALVREWIARINRVWSPASIRFVLEGVIEEAPNRTAGYDAALSKIQQELAEARSDPDPDTKARVPREGYGWRDVLPLGQSADAALDVFVVGRTVGGGGNYLGRIGAVVIGEKRMRSAYAREHASVLAHELGHALGLTHPPCTPEGNLMRKPCDSRDRRRATVSLTAEQIRIARQVASTGKPWLGRKRAERTFRQR